MGEIQFFDMTYEDVIRKYKQTVGAVCVMRLKNYADAQDCFQNTFFILYKNAPHFETETHLKAWLIRVAINECNKYIRKNKPFVSLEKTSADSVDFPTDNCDMSWALSKLDSKYREVLYLFYAEDYEINEIADILQKSPNTIKTLFVTAHKHIRNASIYCKNQATFHFHLAF